MGHPDSSMDFRAKVLDRSVLAGLWPFHVHLWKSRDGRWLLRWGSDERDSFNLNSWHRHSLIEIVLISVESHCKA